MTDFLDLLQKSFAVLAGIDSLSKIEIPLLKKGNLKTAGEQWKDIFVSSDDCSLVWKAWFSEYGIHYLAKLDDINLPDSSYIYPTYLINEATQYQDKEYMIDMISDALEHLFNDKI